METHEIADAGIVNKKNKIAGGTQPVRQKLFGLDTACGNRPFGPPSPL